MLFSTTKLYMVLAFAAFIAAQPLDVVGNNGDILVARGAPVVELVARAPEPSRDDAAKKLEKGKGREPDVPEDALPHWSLTEELRQEAEKKAQKQKNRGAVVNESKKQKKQRHRIFQIFKKKNDENDKGEGGSKQQGGK